MKEQSSQDYDADQGSKFILLFTGLLSTAATIWVGSTTYESFQHGEVLNTVLGSLTLIATGTISAANFYAISHPLSSESENPKNN